MISLTRVRHRHSSHGPMSVDYFVRMSKEDAAALIGSLAAQIEKNDPNASGRIEQHWGEAGVQRGDFVIFVHDEPICFGCQKEVEPWTGRRVRGALFCKECQPKICEYCKGFGGHAEWCLHDRMPKPKKTPRSSKG